ncbi:hypothetical protein [Bacillus sp. BP-3]|nr:hypothetical protein [Bacillus sp. BP-3]MDC2867523.1 hypothetical protein [Bacillus sp. BP-3]
MTIEQLSLDDVIGAFDYSATSTARKKYGRILIKNTYISDKTLKEIMELD